MSGECEICHEQALDCECDDFEKSRLNYAIGWLNMGFSVLYDLGYDVPEKLNFKLRKKNKEYYGKTRR